MKQPVEKLPALILAGGRSTRMGGGDKALLDLGGRSLVAHVVQRLRPQTGALAINANGDPARFDMMNLPVIADVVAGFAGPLAGILCAMEWGIKHGSDFVLTAAGDTPFLPGDLVARLLERAATTGDKAVLASSNGRAHPVVALWSTGLRDKLDAHLAKGGSRKVTDFVAITGYSTVEFVSPNRTGVDPFFNINTPDDLALARKLLEVSSS